MNERKVTELSKLRIALAALAAMLILLLLYPAPVAASDTVLAQQRTADKQQKSFEDFLRSTETLYKAIEDKQLDLAIKSMAVVERRFMQLSLADFSSVESVQLLSRLIAQMKEKLAAMSPEEKPIQEMASALRLAADQLAHPEQPLWHRYRTVLQEDVRRFAESLHQLIEQPTEQYRLQAAEHLAELQARYQLIKPAALLALDPSTTYRTDMVIRYIEKLLQAQKINTVLLTDIDKPLGDAIDGLFPAAEPTHSALPTTGPPRTWSVLMGAFIVTVLSWAVWIRYKATAPP